MTKRLICIECPKGCVLAVAVENSAVKTVTGNRCPKGLAYAMEEVERPVRILTSTVTATGLAVRRVPVRTDKPVPKDRLMDCMDAIHAVKLTHPVKTGEVILRDLLGLGMSVVATRDCPR